MLGKLKYCEKAMSGLGLSMGLSERLVNCLAVAWCSRC